MPKEAIKMGAADEIIPLSEIAQTVLNRVATMSLHKDEKPKESASQAS
jgi:chemotaxis response regulator CheB